MDNEITIKEATFQDLPGMKYLMLKALQAEPTAFSSEYEEYAFNSNEWWNNYMLTYTFGLKDKMFLAITNSHIIGMVGILYDQKKRKLHTSSLVWFYVDENYRKKGIGKRLITRALKSAQDQKVRKITLFVNSTQKNAINLYSEFEFVKVGLLKEDLKINGQFIDTIIMERFFDYE